MFHTEQKQQNPQRTGAPINRFPAFHILDCWEEKEHGGYVIHVGMTENVTESVDKAQ